MTETTKTVVNIHAVLHFSQNYNYNDLLLHQVSSLQTICIYKETIIKSVTITEKILILIVHNTQVSHPN